MTFDPQLTAILDVYPSGATIFRPLRDSSKRIVDFEWLYASATALKLLGRTELLGRRLLVEMPGHIESGLFEVYVGVAESGRRYRGAHRYHGDGLDCSLNLTVLRHDDCVAVFFASTTATGMESAQVESQRHATAHDRTDIHGLAIDELFTCAAHELRAPLNAILGWARMLRDGALHPEQTRKATEAIERNAKAQARLIEDLLDFSRLRMGSLQLELEGFELDQLVETAIAEVTPTAKARGVRLVQSIGNCADQMLGDPSRLRQAIRTLLANVVKRTPKGGQVSVQLECTASCCVLTVENTGLGLGPEAIPHVLEGARHTGSRTAHGHDDLGLELTITQYLVELHDGTIEAWRSGIDGGSTLLVTLPRRDSPTNGRPAAASSPGPHLAASLDAWHVQGLAVLVIDDEPDARELLVSMLTMCGMTVTSAASVSEAMQNIERRTFDVFISDIGMPVQDGYDFIAKLRALPASGGGAAPAIAITAFATQADHTKTLEAGFDAHMTKPVELTDLLALISTLAASAPNKNEPHY